MQKDPQNKFKYQNTQFNLRNFKRLQGRIRAIQPTADCKYYTKKLRQNLLDFPFPLETMILSIRKQQSFRGYKAK